MSEEWRRKHPCPSCRAGYGECVGGWLMNLKCCNGCDHPTRWDPDPWTERDLVEMHRVDLGREARIGWTTRT